MTTDYVDAGYGRSAAVLASAARTATPNSQQISVNGRYSGLVLVVDMTAVTATGTVTVKVEGVDPTSGKTFLLLTSTALAAVATTVLRVRPSLTAAANLTVNDVLPPTILVTATHGNGVSMTYSVGALFTY